MAGLAEDGADWPLRSTISSVSSWPMSTEALITAKRPVKRISSLARTG
jgi:hypothetical protein